MRRSRFEQLVNSSQPETAKPTNPGEPANPTNPSHPSKTTEPTNPSNTGETSNPSNLTETANPGKPTNPTKTSKPTKTGYRGKRANPGEIAPTRDFTRVANSIIRDAVSAGVFSGKSKQLYDVLYQRTRGAIVPKMSAHVPRGVLMTAANISSTVTLKKNLFHLRESGLVTWEERPGVRGGNEYTVYLPEETNPSHPTNPGYPGNTSQKLEGLDSIGPDRANPGLGPNVSSIYGQTNTLSNTYKPIDDDVFKLLASISRITGIPVDKLKLKETCEVLDAAFEKAAARTGTISDPDKFLATILTRALAKPQKEPEVKVEQGGEVVDSTPVAGLGIAGSIQMYRDLLARDYTMDKLRSQFRAAHSEDEWEVIEKKLAPTAAQ